jgi:tetratricopeptide (TPR) repeat protein
MVLAVPVAGAEDADDLYARAESAYQDGELNEAGKILLRLTRQNPEYKQAYVLLGEVYYAKGKLRKAKKSFELAEVKTVEPRFAFAWGASFYNAEEWRVAIQGFKVAAQDQKLKDFAYYYLAVCFYELSFLYKAKKYLNKARPSRLPSRLREGRRKLSKLIEFRKEQAIRSVLNYEESRGPADSLPKRTNPGEVARRSKNDSTYGFKPPSEEQMPETSPPPGGPIPISPVKVDLTPAVIIQQTTSIRDNFGLVENELDFFGHRESFAVDVYRLDKGLPSEDDRSFGVQFYAGAAEYDASQQTRRLFTLQNTSGNFVENSSTSFDEQSGLIAVSPYFKLPINRNYTVSGELFHHEVLPEYDIKQRWGGSHLNLQLAFNGASFGYQAKVQYGGQFDFNDGRRLNDAQLHLGIDWDLYDFTFQILGRFLSSDGDTSVSNNPYRYALTDRRLRIPDGYQGYLYTGFQGRWSLTDGDLSLKLSRRERFLKDSRVVVRRYPTDSIETAAAYIHKVSLGGNYRVFTGVSVGLEGKFQAYGNYAYEAEIDGLSPEESLFLLGVTQLGYQLNLAVQPLEWLNFQAYYGSFVNQYDLEQRLVDQFKSNNPKTAINTNFYLEVAKSF